MTDIKPIRHATAEEVRVAKQPLTPAQLGAALRDLALWQHVFVDTEEAALQIQRECPVKVSVEPAFGRWVVVEERGGETIENHA